MKRKTFSLSVEAGIAGGKDKPPALSQQAKNAILAELEERLSRVEGNQEEAAALRAAADPGLEPITPEDEALVKAFLHREMEQMLYAFIKAHPRLAQHLSTEKTT